MAHDVLVAGETLIDFLPERPGPLESIAGFERRPGGAPANVAVALSRLDRTPLFWTRVGTDPFGRYLERTLAEHGLPERFVERDPAAKTTLAFVTHDADGDREFTFYREDTADTRLEPGTIPDAALDELEWVHAGGVTLASGRSREATLDLLERASAAGCRVSFDPNARPELWSDGRTYRRVVREALDHVDVCKATRTELEGLGFAGDTDRAVARDALAAGLELIFVTRGSDGALAVGAESSRWGGVVERDGFDVDAVDTTGAGDAFVAGAIASLEDGAALGETVAFANAVAASATTAAGAMAALPDRETVRSVLEREPSN